MALYTFFLVIALPSLVGAACNDPSNVCQLDSVFFKPENGYDCFQVHNQQQFMCTCFGNRFTMNEPCRSNVLRCLVGTNNEYSCLCKTENSVDLIDNNPCGTVTSVTTVASTISTSTQQPITMASTISASTQQPSVLHPCLNDGVYDPSMQLCHCPSGFSGRSCEIFDLERVCDRIVCKNGGTCIYGEENGTYYSKCACPLGFKGEYCEINLLVGTCYDRATLDRCDGYICSESVESDGQIYFYCGACPVNAWGALCEHYSDYTPCRYEGDTLIDPYMHEQGKYFECAERWHGEYSRKMEIELYRIDCSLYPLYHNSCPKGLRYDVTKKLCVVPPAYT